jgi:hypothetical protein
LNPGSRKGKVKKERVEPKFNPADYLQEKPLMLTNDVLMVDDQLERGQVCFVSLAPRVHQRNAHGMH